MKKLLTLLLIIGYCGYSQKSIHVYVALCDNVNQGIVQVSSELGNGNNLKTNLYWGAMYGVKTCFSKDKDWSFKESIIGFSPYILERVVFEHKSTKTLLIADAYRGSEISTCIKDFLDGCSTDDSDLLIYVGHDGLMEFDVILDDHSDASKDVMIFSCFSKHYFTDYLKSVNANPILWTNEAMAPEAYTVLAAITPWIYNKGNEVILNSAIVCYANYQQMNKEKVKSIFVSGY